MNTPAGRDGHQDIADFAFTDTDGRSRTLRIRTFWKSPDHVIILATEALTPQRGERLAPTAARTATDVRRVLGITGASFTWIEHIDERGDPYPEAFALPAERPHGEGFAIVEFREQGSSLDQPKRTLISKAEVEALLGISLD